MNCQTFEDIVTDLTRGQMMQVELRDEALKHADLCHQCQIRLSEEEALTRDLFSLVHEMRAVSAPAELKVSLRNEFRLRQQPPVVVQLSHSRGKYWLAAVAAILLIVFSIIGLTWKRQKLAPAEVKTPASVEPTNGVVPTNSQTEQVADNDERKAPVRPKRRVGAHRSDGRRVVSQRTDQASMLAVNNNAREITTDFMPLGYMSSASLQDGGQIVRVEMSRAALASFGLPVNMDRYNEKVKADVVLGIDGVAHAIRFVQ